MTLASGPYHYTVPRDYIAKTNDGQRISHLAVFMDFKQFIQQIRKVANIDGPVEILVRELPMMTTYGTFAGMV